MLRGINFDGRKDHSTMIEENDRCIIKTKEHVAFVEEPGRNFFGHQSLTHSRAIDIAGVIINYIESYSTRISQLMAIRWDGTNVTTYLLERCGNWLLETSFNKPLQ